MTVNNDIKILNFYTPRTTEKWVGIAVLTAVGLVALTSLALSWQKVSPFTEIRGVWNMSFWGGAGLGSLIAAAFLFVRIRPSTIIYRRGKLEYIYTTDMRHAKPNNGYFEYAAMVTKFLNGKAVGSRPHSSNGREPNWLGLEGLFSVDND